MLLSGIVLVVSAPTLNSLAVHVANGYGASTKVILSRDLHTYGVGVALQERKHCFEIGLFKI